MSAWTDVVGTQGPQGPVGPQGPQGVQGIPGVPKLLTSGRPDTLVSLTVAETSHLSVVIPANATAVGDLIRLRSYGTYCTGSAAHKLTYRWYIGGVLVVDTALLIPYAVPVGGVRSPSQWDLSMMVRGGNLADLSGIIEAGAAGTGSLNFGPVVSATGVITADSIVWNPTISNTIQLNVTLSASAATLESRLIGYTIEKIST